MILKRFYDDKLAQASYLVGCPATGQGVVVDPNRDVEPYLETAEAEGVAVTHVTETHIHADFVSGSRELARRTGARLLLSAEGGEDWSYRFAEDDGARLLEDGDVIEVGNVRLQAVHTPGHTPEHLTFLVTDGASADEPIGALTGDFLFVGDVGRPDLLEKAARVEGTMEAAARDLWRSLVRFSDAHPDWLQIWPGHGAGSACGKGLSSIPHSTLGYERRFNWAFQEPDEEAFVRSVLEDQPEPPAYFAEMKRVNRGGPRILGGLPDPHRLDAEELVDILEPGADGGEARADDGDASAGHPLVVDVRSRDSYGEAHVPGTLNIPLDGSFTTWAGWLVPYDRPFRLLMPDDDGAAAREAARDLALIGLDHLEGWFGEDALEAWTAAGGELDSIPETTADELAARLGEDDVHVLDVRGRFEWKEGRIPGVPNIPVGHLEDRRSELPEEGTLVVHCVSGDRSAIAASVLRRLGYEDVVNLSDGFQGWEDRGGPVVRGEPGGEAEAGAAPAASTAG